MRSDIPKQFLLLEGKPVLMHTITKFYLSDPAVEIILVLPAGQVPYWEELCRKYGFTIPVSLVHGGETRFHSVKNGLERVTEPGVVGVHDGVRPLLSPGLISALYASALEKGNCIPCTLPHESLRMQEEGRNYALDRSRCRLIQTPQCFDAALLKKAYEAEYRREFTDDATVVEAAGGTIYLHEGEPENIKITTPADLAVASVLINRAG